MIKMFLVRHGRTIWNKEQIFRGRRNISLDEMGKKEDSVPGSVIFRLPPRASAHL